MRFLLPFAGVLVGLGLLGAAYYAWFCLSWMILRRGIWASLPTAIPAGPSERRIFTAYRVQVGSSVLNSRDNFFGVSASSAGLRLQPKFPVPGRSSLVVPWETITFNQEHGPWLKLQAVVRNHTLTLWLTSRHREQLPVLTRTSV